ncbi:hypothetical protein SAMN02745178_00024 [Gemmiger formicilis]|uniref:Uncharacterized protein n=2 Tax=Gemmiger formicilis TaxID=745368 RepID=A0A1T4W6L1_9FIRM|nr:hypothetical protein SAMN02745178_00024 [Gemmiger formicilis]
MRPACVVVWCVGGGPCTVLFLYGFGEFWRAVFVQGDIRAAADVAVTVVWFLADFRAGVAAGLMEFVCIFGYSGLSDVRVGLADVAYAFAEVVDFCAAFVTPLILSA